MDNTSPVDSHKPRFSLSSKLVIQKSETAKLAIEM